MKREARQHGMVRTYRILPSPWNQRPETRVIQRLDSPPSAGIFSNVPSKPSNHSKFTGKCGRPQCLECHLNPVSKSKDKTKGTQKIRASNMVANPRLIAWRVVDGRPGSKISGFSATGILEHLYGVNEDDDIHDHLNYHDDDGGPCGLGDDNDDFMANFWSLHETENEKGVDIDDHLNYHADDGGPCDVANNDDDFMANFWSLHEKENKRGVEIEEYVDADEKISKVSSNYDYDDDDAMSFCDVGFMVDQIEEDEGWYLVREM